ncbi:unnamed protein product [Adineta steineri]|uniref:G domain-containing protein n=1 Tax=Adineta steineri TaxID=433720 RepID=A0A814E3B9_9BILA|nr:unnamed protein product [Adineta steineri]CAF1256383.1 unnamed protein product [Adineta steineri]
MTEKRILVFGSPNAGKTSMLNELIGIDSAVNSSEDGLVFKIKHYQSVIKDRVKYCFVDIDGLSKTNLDELTFAKATENISNLLQHSKQGFNLLVFVTRAGTIHQSAKDEYVMFADQITKKKIPILCVVTNCENYEPLSQWVTENENTFKENQMTFDKMVGTCFKKGGRFEEMLKLLRKESAETVWNAILDISTEQPIDVVTSIKSPTMFASDIWNNFSAWIGKNIWSDPIPDSISLSSSKKSY